MNSYDTKNDATQSLGQEISQAKPNGSRTDEILPSLEEGVTLRIWEGWFLQGPRILINLKTIQKAMPKPLAWTDVVSISRISTTFF